MKVIDLNISRVNRSKKTSRIVNQFEKLISELNKKALPDNVVSAINEEISNLNSIEEPDKNLKWKLRKSINKIIKLLEKKTRIVVRNHYQMRWMLMGLTIIGVAFGVVLANILDNNSLLGVGIPIGMVLGMAIGARLDKKALDEGRQLDIDIKM